MRKLIFIAAMSSAACASSFAEESLFTARVEQIVLKPSGSDDCPPPCPPETIDKNGVARVCVSNRGGCQAAQVKVEQVFLGASTQGTRTFNSRTGEWGKLNFPNSHEPILVHMQGDQVKWSPITIKDGKAYFNAQPLARVSINGVALSALQQDAQGDIALDSLLQRISAPR